MANPVTPSARERLAVTNAAKTLTAATYLTAETAVVTVETSTIRFTLDGTAPTSVADAGTDLGHLAIPGESIRLQNRHEVVGFKVIRGVAVNAAIEVTYGV